MMETKPIGLYVHIPFCKRKCNYCDFCSVAAPEDKIDKYADALVEEIKSYSENEKIKVDSVFIGGGTPSYISCESFLKIANSIKETFELSSDTEYTVEVNPGTLTQEKIRAFKEAGVNRVSLGLQSIHEKETKKLGRIHNYQDFLRSFNMIKSGLTDNINIDLMYGIPYQTKESFEKTLSSVLELDPAHISCYGLIIEEGTPFFLQKDTLDLPSEDEEYEMYMMADSILTSAGFSHYEISNYAKEGRRCRHNLKYWRDEEYIGVGLSAHSYYRGIRFSNPVDFDEYFDPFREKYRIRESEKLGKDSFEYAMLAMRLSDGFSLSEYEKLFGRSFIEGKERYIDLCVSRGLLKIENGFIKLTSSGFYLSNTILTELLDFPS